jgi:hypothetical protein
VTVIIEVIRRRSGHAEFEIMKATVNLECTPEEARAFLGLPDVTEPNQMYVDALTKAMGGITNFEQLQDYAKQIAPMGQAGLKLFQQVFERSAGAAFANLKGNRGRKRDSED